MTRSIELNVSYGQLAVFNSNISQPFNDWTDRHVSQGFAWRPSSVSFRTVSESGPHSVQIQVVEHLGAVQPGSVRAIEVPFDVSDKGEIEVSSISESVPLMLAPGTYLLRCEFVQAAASGTDKARLTFASKDLPRFAVAKADQELAIDGELLTTAQPAPG